MTTHCFSFSFTDGTGVLCSSITGLIKGGMMTVYVDELVLLHYHYVTHAYSFYVVGNVSWDGRFCGMF